MSVGLFLHQYMAKLFTIVKIIGLFAMTPAASANTTPAFLLCEKLLNHQQQPTEVDLLLFKKSKTTHVLSGAARATAENVKHDPNKHLREGDLINRWYAYFIGDQNDCFGSPTNTMDNLNTYMNILVQKQADSLNVHMPVHIFFMCSDGHYTFPTPSGNQYPMSSKYSRIQNLTYSMHKSVILNLDEQVLRYQFDEASAVMMLGAGDHWNPSAWEDEYTLARELSFISKNPSGAPKYYTDAMARFRAYQLTGKTNPGHESEMNIAKPPYASINSLFEDGHKIANTPQMATLYAHFLYKLENKMIEMNLTTKMESLLKRIEDLLSNAYTSKNHNSSTKEFKYSRDFARAQAEDVFNYLTSSTIQASIEQHLPFELTEWLCEEWDFFGVKGPFARHRIYDKTSVTGRRLIKEEEKYNSIIMPDRWKNCDELYGLARLKHSPAL